ncbi:MAG: enoyl-CoA hydratase-related protein, partial [Pseudomonadota bacterium]
MGLVEVTLDPRGVAVVTLSRAEKHNALSAEMMVELHELADRLGQDPSVRVVVLAGAGRSFCAGADLGWMQEQMEADAEGRAVSARTLAHMLMVWNLLPKPVIGRVQGNAFGGGVGLMAVCDVVVAVE